MKLEYLYKIIKSRAMQNITEATIIAAIEQTVDTLSKQTVQSVDANTKKFRDEVMGEISAIKQSIAELHTLQKKTHDELLAAIEKMLLGHSVETARDINALRIYLDEQKPKATAAKGKAAGKLSLEQVSQIANSAISAGAVDTTGTITTTTTSTILPAGTIVSGAAAPAKTRKAPVKKAAPKVKPVSMTAYFKNEGQAQAKFIQDNFFSPAQRQMYIDWHADKKNANRNFWTSRTGAGEAFTYDKTSEGYIKLTAYLQKIADDANAQAAAEVAANEASLVAEPDSEEDALDKEIF